MFITLDGVDGSGKSSIARALHDYMETHHPETVTRLTREPGGVGTHIGEQLRNIVLDTHGLLPETQLFLFTASRLEHCHKFILPALLAGHTVICDRFSASTFVYQFLDSKISLYLYNNSTAAVRELFTRYGLRPYPDLQLILDVDYDTAHSRIASRLGQKPNAFDVMSKATFDLRRAGYLAYASSALNCNSVVIDSAHPPQSVLQACITVIEEHLGKHNENQLR